MRLHLRSGGHSVRNADLRRVLEVLGVDAGRARDDENIPRVQIPYPVAGTSDKSQRDVAEQVAPQILDKLMARQAVDAGHC